LDAVAGGCGRKKYDDYDYSPRKHKRDYKKFDVDVDVDVVTVIFANNDIDVNGGDLTININAQAA
jgi:hypothetical protein